MDQQRKNIFCLRIFFISLFFIANLCHAANSTNFAKYVDIGQGRHLYLQCKGTGSPTVILESGYRNNSDVWTIPLNGKLAIFPAVASFTHVCVYDRPGTIGWTINDLSRSDKITMPRTIESVIDDLHHLLHTANIPGPYLLVGHSLGGLFIKLYASMYPEDVVGLILVDAYPENLQSQLGAKNWQAYLKITIPAPPGIKDLQHFEAIDFNTVSSVMKKASPLKTMPLIVISRGQAADLPAPGGKAILTSAAFEQAWQAGQHQLASLMPNTRHIIAKKSQHYIQYSQPELVIDAIHHMVNTVRKQQGTADAK